MSKDKSAHREKNAQKRGRPFSKGNPGRPKGTPNKITVALKDAIIQAAESAGGSGGMVAYLKKQAIDHPGAFMTLLGKVLPPQSDNDGNMVEPHPPELIKAFWAAIDCQVEQRAEELALSMTRSAQLPDPTLALR